MNIRLLQLGEQQAPCDSKSPRQIPENIEKSPLDVYAGFGATYAWFDDVDGSRLADFDIVNVGIDDKLGWVANLGASYRISGPLRIGVDAKYLQVSTNTFARFADGTESSGAGFTFSAFQLGAGLAVRF